MTLQVKNQIKYHKHLKFLSGNGIRYTEKWQPWRREGSQEFIAIRAKTPPWCPDWRPMEKGHLFALDLGQLLEVSEHKNTPVQRPPVDIPLETCVSRFQLRNSFFFYSVLTEMKQHLVFFE